MSRVARLQLASACVALAALALPRSAYAEDVSAGPGGALDETRPAKPNGKVDVHIFSGHVKVTGWAQNFVHVRGTIDDSCKLEITPAGDRTQVGIHCSDGPPDAQLEIQIPQASALDASTMSADLEVHDVNGGLQLHTVTADIGVQGGTPTEIDASTTSASIAVHANAGRTSAHLVSGDVKVTGVHGHVNLHTVSGECSLSGQDFTDVSVESVSGEIVVEGSLASDARFEVQSHSGDVKVRIPQASNADAELRSFSGDLQVDLGGKKSSATGEQHGMRVLEARAGNGGAKIRARSFSGDVSVSSYAASSGSK